MNRIGVNSRNYRSQNNTCLPLDIGSLSRSLSRALSNHCHGCGCMGESHTADYRIVNTDSHSSLDDNAVSLLVCMLVYTFEQG